MFAIYKNNIYKIFYQSSTKVIGTNKEDKKLEGFVQPNKCYIIEWEKVKDKIQSIYDVKFYVTYVNKTKTRRGQRIWQVSENIPLHRGFDIEKNEVGIWVDGMSRSSDWIQFDSCFCSKIIDISECSDFTVRYEYSRKDGVDYEEPLIEEQEVTAEEFKLIMVSYRRQNI